MKRPVPPYVPMKELNALDRAGELDHIIPIYRQFAIRVDALLPDPENVRVHPEDNVEATDVSLDRYLQREPIVVNVNREVFLRACRIAEVEPQGLVGVIEAGNSRHDIYKTKGLEWIAVAFVDDDLETHTGFAISDNRTAEMATWDIPQLLLQVERLDWKPAGISDTYYAELQAVVHGGGAFDPLPAQGDLGDDQGGGDAIGKVSVTVTILNTEALANVAGEVQKVLDQHPEWRAEITHQGRGGGKVSEATAKGKG